MARRFGRLNAFIPHDPVGYLLVILSILMALGIYLARVRTYDLDLHQLAIREGLGFGFLWAVLQPCLALFGVIVVFQIAWTVVYTYSRSSFLPLIVLVLSFLLALFLPHADNTFWCLL